MLPPGTLETYSIGLPGSVDLEYASLVAKHLGTKHTSITTTPEIFFESIPLVIKDIESYDTTTVRASVGNYLIGKYISAHSEAKVIFNGDGADELMGGYLYMKQAPNFVEFDKECKRLLRDIHMFDVLRSDKCISSHGLEPRTPYLDRTFVEKYLSIPAWIRFPINTEKIIIRKCVEEYMPDLIPREVLYRRKEAFSDGVSSQDKSWFSIIQEKVEELGICINDPDLTHNTPVTSEMKYYRSIFDREYPNCEKLVKYFWMPKYTDATDPSARTLKEYSN
jgi:asparagine synthase (glutamine-hydrolysing)